MSKRVFRRWDKETDIAEALARHEARQHCSNVEIDQNKRAKRIISSMHKQKLCIFITSHCKVNRVNGVWRFTLLSTGKSFGLNRLLEVFKSRSYWTIDKTAKEKSGHAFLAEIDVDLHNPRVGTSYK